MIEGSQMKTDNNVVINRETYWKEALFTRGKFGYNKISIFNADILSL